MLATHSMCTISGAHSSAVDRFRNGMSSPSWSGPRGCKRRLDHWPFCCSPHCQCAPGVNSLLVAQAHGVISVESNRDRTLAPRSLRSRDPSGWLRAAGRLRGPAGRAESAIISDGRDSSQNFYQLIYERLGRRAQPAGTYVAKADKGTSRIRSGSYEHVVRS